VQTTEKPKRKIELDKALSTRNGTLAVSAIAALVAGALLLVFLNQYRESTREDGATVNVVVAKRLIERGSAADVLADEGVFERTRVRKDELKQGAIVDPASLEGKIAAGDVYPGEQVTAADFSAVYPRAIYKLSGASRAIAIPTDAVRSNTTELRAGDRVDILAAFNSTTGTPGAGGKPVLQVLQRNVLVLRAPVGGNGAEGSSGGNIVLKARDVKAAHIAYAVDNGQLWLLLRPQTGATNSAIPPVTLEALLFDSRPIPVDDGQIPTEEGQ
jgi:Flp pilus assembly protein CpaB